MAALPKHNRLSGKKEFAQLFSGTRPLPGANLSLRALRASINAPFRVAVLITSKAIPLATQRNLARRRVSAAVAHLVKVYGIRPGVRIAISVRTAQLPGPADLREELLSLMKKSGILNS